MNNKEKNQKLSFLKNQYSRLLDKLSKSIVVKIREQGKLPFFLVVLIWIVFWGSSFYFITVFMPVNLLWLRVFLPVFISLIVVNASTELGKKVVGYHNEKEEKVEKESSSSLLSEEKDISTKEGYSLKSTFILRDKKGKKIFLINKGKIIPVFLVSILSTGNKEKGYTFSSLLNYPLRNEMKEIEFSVLDTDKGEYLLFLGKEYKTKNKNYTELLKENEQFFSKIEIIVAELKRDNNLELEAVEDSILNELFPLYSEVLCCKNEDTNKKEQKIEEKNHLQLKSENNNLNNANNGKEYNQNGESSNRFRPFSVKTELTPYQLTKVAEKKELLLSELTYSFDNFIDMSKVFYKKALEHQLNAKFPISEDNFLKLIQLFVEKNKYEFFYPSFFKLEKYESFKVFETPSSEEIEEFSEELVKECMFTNLDTEVKKELHSFLTQKIKNRKHRQEVKPVGIKVSSTIPRPSVKSLSES
ncbi:MAG: hypothetical protein K9W45_01095 [Candidatus Heimdallarchaeum aukensis]|uniref:Uncharacterized protein n=1 Tax=Candidatus Heimdallarchaeum aukensis TaxID=2876573 RepID=A0A9Y1BL58_9ARCH|nr:MAG: hypothetical protein K9W45_01095 [Candidatus Heimdallarchaeum aukensis]